MRQELIGSTAVHGLVALFLFFVSAPGRLPPPLSADDVMLVTPVDALPAQFMRAPEAEVPAAAEDAAAEQVAAVTAPEPEAVPIRPKPAESKPKPKPAEPKPPAPEPTRTEEAPSQAAGTGKTGDVYESRVQSGAGSAQGGSLLGLPGGTPGGRPATYPDRVTNKVFYMWRNPVKLPESVTASIVFRIDADGRASQIALERSSGLPAFDNATLRAVYEAAPYPPFPRSMREEYIVMRIVFEYLP